MGACGTRSEPERCHHRQPESVKSAEKGPMGSSGEKMASIVAERWIVERTLA